MTLPLARSHRWQPLRSGLMNIFRYDYDEFHFERGRLLLRGNNGTGKSRVLALQLPFLLDGEANPARLEPDGDPAKRIEWNLLVDQHESRTGYTWIEFGRIDDDDVEHYITLGCGMLAVKGRTGVTKWFFTTHQRIGKDLFLQTSNKVALSREGLKQALDTSGQFFTTAKAYRKAVDTALFQLGPERYGALVDLLINLRRPQLARELNEAKLSRALSDALPPLPEGVLAEVAESFRSLEDDAAQLRTFEAARDGATAFLKDYERYCKVAALRRTDPVREANAAYEGAQREVRAHESARVAAAGVADEAEAAAQRLDGQATDTRTRIAVLKDSDAMHDVAALDRAKQYASACQIESAAAGRRLGDAEATVHDAAQALDRANEAVEVEEDGLVAKLKEARRQAAEIGQEQAHDVALLSTGLPGRWEEVAIEHARRDLDVLIGDRKHASAHIAARVQEHERARRALSESDALRARAEADVDDAVEAAALANRRVVQEGERLRQALHTWGALLYELSLPEFQSLEEDLACWCEGGEGENPVGEAVDRAAEVTRQHLSALIAEVKHRESARVADLELLLDEQRQLEEGRHSPPPTPYTRDADVRVRRPGAPLWRVCDFRSELDEAARAGLEGALEGAGLLDAWITPTGELLADSVEDTCLVSTDDAPPRASLAQLLRVEIDSDDSYAAVIPPAVVESVLARIGTGEGDNVWVDTTGRWRLGPLHGAWNKTMAQHVGAGARKAHRRQRLVQLVAEIEHNRHALEVIREKLATLTSRMEALAAEVAAVPKDDDLRQAHAALATARTFLQRQRQRLITEEDALREARRALDLTRRTLDDDARDLVLTGWVDNLRGHDEALAEYRQVVVQLWPAIDAVGRVRSHRAEATGRVEGTQKARSERLREADEAAAAARKADIQFATLEEARGAAAREIVVQLKALRDQLAELESQHGLEVKRLDDHKIKVAIAKERVATSTTDMERHDTDREKEINVLQRFVRGGLLSVACPDIAEFPDVSADQWSVKRAVEVARRIDQALTNVAHDDGAWNRVQTNFHEEYEKFQGALRSLDFSPVIRSAEHGLYVATVPFRGLEQTIPDFRDTLNNDISERQGLLAAGERRILEEHLIGEVAAHLRELLHEGELWITKVNDVLASRATSTGMALRFKWLPAEDGPPELGPARDRLLRTASAWSPQEREEVSRFLQTQIDRVRATDEAATWHEHITRAFDYRLWHRIAIERNQDGAWKRLTKRTHGTGSGGEKAIALTLPQFAAASAHYDSAHPLAPRLILLDEAFVGVDSDMRSKCMSFLEHFDLDFVMTSEREWGCYATLRGVAIYQLVTRPGIWAVGMTRWQWNGNQRVRTETFAAKPRAPQIVPQTPQLSLIDGSGVVDEPDI